MNKTQVIFLLIAIVSAVGFYGTLREAGIGPGRALPAIAVYGYGVYYLCQDILGDIQSWLDNKKDGRGS